MRQVVDDACQGDQPGVRPPSHLVLVETLGLAKDCLAQELEPREQELSLIGHGSWKGHRRETVVPRCSAVARFARLEWAPRMSQGWRAAETWSQ